MVKLLLAKDGVDPNSKDNCGRTLLSWAAGMGHEALMKTLLAKAVVDPDSRDMFGRTPLSWAVRRGNSNVVKLLLQNHEENGINIRDENVDITTPPTADHRGRIICDICISSIPNVDIHYHCGICSDGDFDICQECFASRAFCLDQSHKLIKLMVKDGTLVGVPD
jgi:ankyrin repeat protein